VWNGNSPNAIPWKNEDDIINAILAESANIGKTNKLLVQSVESFVNAPAPFLEFNDKKPFVMSTKKYGCSVIIITTLNQLNTIQEAVSYLKLNFIWRKTEASQKFLALVKRRFTN
jgi:hypothetical protein